MEQMQYNMLLSHALSAYHRGFGAVFGSFSQFFGGPSAKPLKLLDTQVYIRQLTRCMRLHTENGLRARDVNKNQHSRDLNKSQLIGDQPECHSIHWSCCTLVSPPKSLRWSWRGEAPGQQPRTQHGNKLLRLRLTGGALAFIVLQSRH